MTLSIRLTETTTSFSKKVNLAIAERLNRKIRSKNAYIASRTRNLVQMWVRAQPELLSLATAFAAPGSLASQLGFPYGTSKGVADLVSVAVASTVRVTVKNFDSNLNGGVLIEVQPQDFTNLLGLGDISIKGGSLPWLDWMLTQGNATIITGYEYNAGTGLGRSGGGNMKSGGAWRVPPEYAGTLDDNFVTRALRGPMQAKDIARIFQSLFR